MLLLIAVTSVSILAIRIIAGNVKRCHFYPCNNVTIDNFPSTPTVDMHSHEKTKGQYSFCQMVQMVDGGTGRLYSIPK